MAALVLPLPQSPEFARTCQVLGHSPRQITDNGQDNALHCVTLSRRFGCFGWVDLVSRGPVTLCTQARRDWLDNTARRQRHRPLLLNAENMAPADLRAAGYWPVMTPACLARLPLGPADGMRRALHQKWRNRLVRAEAAGLQVQRRSLKADHWLLPAAMRQAKERRYRMLPPAFALAFATANPGGALVWDVTERGSPVAALLMLRHGAMATWLMGHSTARGRQLNAANLALWQAALWLADQGHRMIDLGTVNMQDAPGLAHFKLRCGAQLWPLGGSWLYQRALAPVARVLPLPIWPQTLA